VRGDAEAGGDRKAEEESDSGAIGDPGAPGDNAAAFRWGRASATQRDARPGDARQGRDLRDMP